MLMVKTRTGSVAYESCGAGTPLVMLHANPGDHRDFEGVMPALADQFRVIAVDWPGYGDSPAPKPPKSASAMLFADLLEDVIDGLGLEKLILMGNSVGGYAAARFAITHPERVLGLILVSTGGFTPRDLASTLFCKVKGNEFVTRLAAGRFARAYLKRRTPITAQILARTDANRAIPSRVVVDAAVWRSFADPAHDLRKRAASITAPTLIISGRHDPVIRTKADAQATAASIRNSKLVVMDTGHEPFAEDPKGFLEQVTPFLKQVSGQYVTSNS